MTRFGRVARHVVDPVGVLLALVVVPVALLLTFTWLSGQQLQIVESGSMTPTYPVDSVLVVAPVRGPDVAVGDVVVFADPARHGALVSHRVIAIEESDRGALAFRTRGDANGAADPDAVPATALRGTVVRHIPGLGRVLGLVRWPTGGLLFVGLPVVLLALDARRRRNPRPAMATGVATELA